MTEQRTHFLSKCSSTFRSAQSRSARFAETIMPDPDIHDRLITRLEELRQHMNHPTIWTNGMEQAYLTHKNVYGAGHLERILDQAMEECAELLVRLAHEKRKRSSGFHVTEEYADLYICMEFYRKTLGIDNDIFKTAVDAKTQKLNLALDEREFERRLGGKG